MILRCCYRQLCYVSLVDSRCCVDFNLFLLYFFYKAAITIQSGMFHKITIRCQMVLFSRCFNMLCKMLPHIVVVSLGRRTYNLFLRLNVANNMTHILCWIFLILVGRLRRNFSTNFVCSNCYYYYLLHVLFCLCCIYYF